MLFKNLSDVPCRHCGKTMEETPNLFLEERYDYYGLSTGHWCDGCYENNYPYRRDAYYDYSNAGEHMDDDY